MENLTQIRDNFMSECSNLVIVARAYDSFYRIMPDLRLHTDKSPFPVNIDYLNKLYDDMSKIPNMHEKVIQAQMLSEWRLFLTRIFEWHVYQVLQQGASYKIKVRLSLEFPLDIQADLADNIQAKATQEFDRRNYDDQLTETIKVLGKPIKKEQENLQFIKKHKVIRDVIQHNRGELRESDFVLLGVNKFTLLTSPTSPTEGERVLGQKTYRAGNTVKEITCQELEQLNKNLKQAAIALIPD